MYEESIELFDSLIQCLRPLLNLIDSSPEKEFQDYRNRIDLALISCLSAKKFLQEKAPQEDSIFARNRIRLHLERQKQRLLTIKDSQIKKLISIGISSYTNEMDGYKDESFLFLDAALGEFFSMQQRFVSVVRLFAS